VTEDILEYLFDTYDIQSEFADVIASFGQNPNIAEASSNNAAIYGIGKKEKSQR
jgi:hypothetical protein